MSEDDAALLGADGLEILRLNGIRAFGFHGVHADERRQGQTFVVDVTGRLRRTPPADDVATTVDYAVLAAEVAALVSGEPYDLLETLAGRIADHCLTHARLDAVVITVHKPDAPMPVPVSDAAITVARSRA